MAQSVHFQSSQEFVALPFSHDIVWVKLDQLYFGQNSIPGLCIDEFMLKELVGQEGAITLPWLDIWIAEDFT